MRDAARALLAALTVAAFATACGVGGTDVDAAATDGRLLDSQATIPREEGFDYADIVTDDADLHAVWRRFALQGEPPTVDLDVEAILVVGFGESGSCPATFDGVDTTSEEDVRVVIGIDSGPPCTDDYNPRTFVIALDRDELPDGGFVLALNGSQQGRHGLAAAPLEEPPPWPSPARNVTAENVDVRLVADPPTVEQGANIEVVADNRGAISVTAGSWPLTLRRWEAQRWLPAGDGYGEHPAIGGAGGTAEPGQRARVTVIDTSELAPGWYTLDASLQAGGRLDATTAFEVTP